MAPHGAAAAVGWRSMRSTVIFGLILTLASCSWDTLDSTDACGGSTCGFIDHRYASTFYCPPGDLRPGGWHGYVWRDLSDCHAECASAAAWGCDATGCDTSCDHDTGSGAWLPCTPENGGQETSHGCYLAGSGVNGETVACVCR